MNLAKFPRKKYTESYTPIEKLNNFSEVLGGPTIYFKRDDLTAEYYLAEENKVPVIFLKAINEQIKNINKKIINTTDILGLMKYSNHK